jgi:hypothetical protein
MLINLDINNLIKKSKSKEIHTFLCTRQVVKIIESQKAIKRYFFVLTIITAIIILYYMPETLFKSDLNEYSYCIHKQIFGINCPGCGLTRAIFYFIHFEYKKAILLNPTVVIAILTITGELLYQLKQNERLRKIRFILYLSFCISLLTHYLTLIFNH